MGLVEASGVGIYDGVVSGSGDNVYTVHIDTEHPRKSFCNCPFADGRRVVCKHMIALYFTAEPKVAKDFLKEVEKREAEEEEREWQHYEDMKEYVKSLSKMELQEQLFRCNGAARGKKKLLVAIKGTGRELLLNV